MKHLGDITKINGSEVPPVDVIIGGSPCQDLSVAGKRAGLAGERSGLFMEQIRIIKEMRSADEQRNGTAHVRPRYMVWENVPGAFSSNKGQDFRAVLEETARIVEKELPDIPVPEGGGWHYSGVIMGSGFSIAWRVFDAQFWGVPQRRRRIALVADFGGYTAPEILFERKSVRGYTPPRETPWKDFAAAVAERFGGADKARENSELAYCIQGNCIDRADTSGCNGKGWTENVSYTLNTVDRPAVYDARGNGDGQIAPTMTGDHENRVTDYTSLICTGGEQRVAGFKYGAGVESGIAYREEQSPTLLAGQNDAAVAIATSEFVAQTPKHNIINATPGSFMNFDDKGLAFTLSARDYKDPQYVCLNSFDCQSKRVFDTSGVAPTLASGTNEGMNIVPSVLEHSTVRRLTPLECERLQGFPDGWTDIDDYIDTNGKKHKASDTARYKALGNSIALPSWVWVLERLSSYCGNKPTMASLFDGIGGFPLIWETLNGTGTCLWASEIEEFPIAVTKLRFGED